MTVCTGYREQHVCHGGQMGTRCCLVQVIDDHGHVRPLDPRTDLYNHSPTGFEWAYNGSGPAQLALALAADATNDRRALRVCQRLKAQLVARLHHDGWRLEKKDLLRLIAAIEAQMGEGAL